MSDKRKAWEMALAAYRRHHGEMITDRQQHDPGTKRSQGLVKEM